MRSLQSALKAILILLLVLVLDAPHALAARSATSGFKSGVATLKTLSLEDDFAVLASSPDSETAEKTADAEVGEEASGEAGDEITSETGVTRGANIVIRAVNPGYNTEAGKNAGELIELVNLDYAVATPMVALDGLTLVYTTKASSANPSGKSIVLYTFPEGARLTGPAILLRFAEAPEVADGAQDLTYETSLAMAGSLSLELDNEVVSSVCWLGGEDCLPTFSTTVKSRAYTTIVRDEATGEYRHTNDYAPLFELGKSGLYLPEADNSGDTGGASGTGGSSAGTSGASGAGGSSAGASETDSGFSGGGGDFDSNAASVCQSLEFSEILSYYVDDATEQFVEFYNSSGQPIYPMGCKLHYKNKLYDITADASVSDASGAMNRTANASASISAGGAGGDFYVPAYGYLLYRPEIKLTKNPTSENLYELLDVNGDIVDALSLPHGQKSGTSYAQTAKNPDTSETWQLTYAPTPGAPNVYQEFRSCPTGKVLNEATGNCVNATTLSSTLKDCGEGKYRNPETGRCKSYSSDSDGELAPCKEGYERNPETNRCRKIVENNGADYPLVPITDTEETSSFIALWAILGIAGLGAIYVLFQFRREIWYSLRKLFAGLVRKP